MDLPRGMKDFENMEIQKIEYIRQHFNETANTFGFALMEPSTIELMSVIEAKSGVGIRDDVYFFNDKGNREVSLRFDFTIGLTRYIAGQKSMKLPAKISAFGGVWRYDEPQKGRYRFFHQWDIEIFGKQNTETDAEIIEFTSKFFSNLGLENIVLSISHRKITHSISSMSISFAMSYVAGSFPKVILHTLSQFTIAPCSAFRHFSRIALMSVGFFGSCRNSHPDILINACASFGKLPPN